MNPRYLSRRRLLAAASLLVPALLASPSGHAQTERKQLASEQLRLQVDTVAKGLENPWAIAFLPDGRMLVTERPGRLRVVAADGKLSAPVANVPAVSARGQGGLLDVILDPDFASNRTIFLSYSEPRDGGNGTAIARGRLNDAATALENVQVIFRQQPTYDGTHHFGSRLVVARDGKLFVTLGERNNLRDKAQELDNHLGKVVRIERDGSVPRDNPFVGRAGAKPEIWSYGHRNPQSAALHPDTGVLWTVEHGARGGDEINIPQAGKNYGWPVISYGRHYSMLPIGEGTTKPGMEQPLHYWDPSIAPSGMAFVTSPLFPQWKGNMLVGALAGQHLMRVTLDGNKVTGQEKLLADLDARIRDVRQGPDGAVWVLTDASDGKLIRITPAK
ncbi:PQQ-dependent sugar dehydrogenase [Uliginosibacterium sp. H1]|uniref:PQQ-dependent sugar dehydrogenase n=1 Tax=Uliginosibacterium sp. H1 TaxID=3114757 RepID=UPI002E17AE1A|nr:PQQ-dependent sugar dehydrogenase [Uliginosibacterium sp. H1]